jgi:hypothetical protein
MTATTALRMGVLALFLLAAAAAPAAAQLADPLSLATSGVLLPFFSDSAAGFVSMLEIVSPVATPGFTNPLHAVFFRATCERDSSIGDLQTLKQAKAFISTASPISLNFNGLAAIAMTVAGNDLLPLNFPVHARTHWIDAKTGRVRELEPIVLDTFASLTVGTQAGPSNSIGLCGADAVAFARGLNNGFCWSPLRSAAAFVTPQETASLKASIYLICPTQDIQQGSAAGAADGTPPPLLLHTGGVFNPNNGFIRIQNRDGSTGFPWRSVADGLAKQQLRGRIYNDDESGPRDIVTSCACLTIRPILSLDSIYSTAPVNLGSHTVPLWYTELEVQTQTWQVNTADAYDSQWSFTGYWGLEVAGHQATFFHRMSPASLDNLSFGIPNPFANR